MKNWESEIKHDLIAIQRERERNLKEEVNRESSM